MTTKKTVKKKTVKKVEPEDQVLSQEEILKFEIYEKDITIKSLEIMVNQLQKKLTEFQISQEIEKRNSELKSLQDKKQSYKNQLTKRFSLQNENWGFDPITGEIKDE